MSLGALKRFAQQPEPRAGERCEMCAHAIEGEHPHVVDIQAHRLMCTCRACYLLFTQGGAAQGRLRAVPERFRFAPGLRLGEETWTRLEIPMRTAFFLPGSQPERVMVFYPGPAGRQPGPDRRGRVRAGRDRGAHRPQPTGLTGRRCRSSAGAQPGHSETLQSMVAGGLSVADLLERGLAMLGERRGRTPDA
jgi:hypothetical protein